MNHIELFAGCGGLSLGLESTGFELLLANELSPMAAETFAFNFFGEDLDGLAAGATVRKHPAKTKWLSSNFAVDQMASRLREDPRGTPPVAEGISDLQETKDLKGSLVIGSIVELNKWLARNDDALNALKTGFGTGGVDLVSGGPPCQSFSMAGMREYSNARNILPQEFANFVKMTQPKMALLENVTGILRPFDVDGEKVYAWFEVAKAFVGANYVPLCLHVNAKFAGVAQNRPRFLMVLFRKDVYLSLAQTCSEDERALMAPSKQFYDRAKADPSLAYSADELPCFDVANARHLSLFRNSFLSPLVKFCDKPYSVRDAIDDLKGKSGARSGYVDYLDSSLARHTRVPAIYAHVPGKAPKNHDLRRNSPLVQRRFRIYQVLSTLPRKVQREVKAILSGDSLVLSDESFDLLAKHQYVGADQSRIKFGSSGKDELIAFLLAHKTKKQTQKALDPLVPAPAALSIPDDACHYENLRTLSVREMARIQSFPDSFVFRSKVTTGGKMRKFEVPQYTQVGNAVPPLLGRALGKIFGELLGRLDKESSLPSFNESSLSRHEETLQA
ncbi:DNA cytosine methyltransferase [Massilia sp. GCM10020059]|uniref:DNA (cytosine-5-)-methyltransferase n=1 Tax=Massilia agrisoli TaxID=2892444 RepID=A0ABS8IPX7_9BURK|nr:DNA cytosine methyltransferase [Massilia agrisoli]MCC6070569.1 DNA cytosine methyltransferase [Massilia agrisoli]